MAESLQLSEPLPSIIYVVVIAHPDDESMFFFPTIINLIKQQCMVWLLCLSTGDYDGLGNIRQTELLEVGKLIGIHKTIILDTPLLQDHPSRRWDKVTVASSIRTALTQQLEKEQQYANKLPELALITFDPLGISGHINHIDTHYGVCQLIVQQRLNARMATKTTKESQSLYFKEAWQLETEMNLLFKYLPIVSWMYLLGSMVSLTQTTSSNTKEDDIRIYRLHQPTINWNAMKTHKSQFVWYRRLFIIFSCYTYYNKLTMIASTIKNKNNKNKMT